MPPTTEAFYIDAWRVEPSLNRIAGPGGAASVEPRLMRILMHLAAHPGEVVTREALMDAGWGPGSIVSDSSLTGSVSELRKLFEDDPAAPRIIETIRGRGYRLVAPVSATPTGPLTPPTRGRPRAPRTRQRVFVFAPLVVLAAIGLGFVLAGQMRESALPADQRIAPLTALQGVELGPSFSPDGQQVAFVRFAENLNMADLFVQAVGAETPTRLTDFDGAEFYPTWSPDGQRIAFVWNRPAGCGIYLVPATGGAAQKLWEGNYSLRQLDWSPDGRWIAFSYAADEQAWPQIYRLAVETLTLDPVTESRPASWDVWPRFSPDGRHLAFRRGTSEQSEDLYVIALDDPAASPRRLTHDDVPLLGFGWLPGTDDLVFASHRENKRGLWRLPASGGTPRLLRTLGTKDMDHFTLAHRGSRAAFIQDVTEVNLWQLALRTSDAPAPRPLLTSTYLDTHPQFSPDGRRLAFVSSRSGHPELWLAAPDGADLRKRTALGNATLTLPRWSPDGTRLAFEMRTEGQADVYLLDAEEGAPRRFTRSASNDVAPSWSHDGRFLYFGSDRSGEWQIWKAPVEGGPPAQVTKDGGYAGMEAPGGDALFFVTPDSPQLWELSFETGRRVARSDTLTNQSLVNVTAAASGLYFLNWRIRGSVFALYHLAWDTGTVRHVATLPQKTVHYYYRWGLAVSPDEATVLFGSIDREESDIMILENFR